LVALFQPHLFTRTRDFAADFGRALHLADVILLADIYPARERPIEGISSALIERAAREAGSTEVQMVGSSNIAASVHNIIRERDVLVVMGAGDITRVADELSPSKRESRRS